MEHESSSACAVEQPGRVLVTPACERLVVGAGVDGVGAELRRQPHDLALRWPLAQVEAAAELAQPRVEIGQPLEHQPHADACGTGPAEAADRARSRRRPARARGRGERRVVVDPQVAPEPHELGGASPGIAVMVGVGATTRETAVPRSGRMPPFRSRAMRRLRGVAVDTTALRDSRDFRLLVIGGLISGIGTQVTLVALPYQVFVLTRSSFLVGMLGLVELVPLVVVALLGGTLADRMDRRRLLVASQLAQAMTSLALVIGAAAGIATDVAILDPPMPRAAGRRRPMTMPPSAGGHGAGDSSGQSGRIRNDIVQTAAALARRAQAPSSAPRGGSTADAARRDRGGWRR